MNEINSICIVAWLTLDPDVGSCHYGKHQKEHSDEDKHLKIVGSHSLHSKQYGPQQLTLSGREGVALVVHKNSVGLSSTTNPVYVH